ncbi:hypothetical protein OAO18_06890 [Francisellaceae bacterium]|nr:hypothetical protein [Francisellaceae bacterium]
MDPLKQYKAVFNYSYLEGKFLVNQLTIKPLVDKFPQIEFIYSESQEQYLNEIEDADFIFSMEMGLPTFKTAKNLKALFSFAAGKDRIDKNIFETIPCYTGHFHGRLISESLVGLICHFNQNFSQISSNMVNRYWGGHSDFSNRRTLNGQKVAIIGYGHIGRYCSRLLNSLGMEIYAFQRSHDQGSCFDAGAIYTHLSELNNVVNQFDHVVSLLPQTEETNDIFNYEFFKKMKNTACFYNFGRGNSVVEGDLIKALNNNEINGAALDVVKSEPLEENSPLWSTEKLMILPHISAYYTDYFNLYIDEVVSQLVHFFDNHL